MTFWGMGNALHKGGMVSPGLWLRRELLAVLSGNKPDVIHTDLAACNAYKDAPARAAAGQVPDRAGAGRRRSHDAAGQGQAAGRRDRRSRDRGRSQQRALHDGRAAGRDARCAEVVCLTASRSSPARPRASAPRPRAAWRRTATRSRCTPALGRGRPEDGGRAGRRQLPPGRSRRRGGDPRAGGVVLDQHGRLDVLVNNAGLSIRIPHADLKAATPALWRQMLDVNLISPFILVAEAEAALRRRPKRAALRRQHRHPCRRPAQGVVDPLCRREGGAASRDQAAGARACARSGSMPWRPAWSRRR